MDTKIKLIGVLFGQLGASFESCYKLLNIDFEGERIRREQENAEKVEEIFTPRLTNFTVNSDALNGKEANTEKDEINQNKDKDKKISDKRRSDSKLSDI